MADDAGKTETLGQMKQRHKLEARTLQNDIKNFQKKAKKDKMNKKDMETQIQKMEEDLVKRHESEIASLADEEDAAPPAVAAPAQEAAPPKPQGPSKAQRRKENKKQKERERQERIEEENKHTVSERQIEADIILAKLSQFKLVIKDIPSDGHCMYHAVADQMKRHNFPLTTEEPAYQYLRRLTSEYMLAHPDDFLPFLALEEDGNKSMTELYMDYCDRVANTSDWGGQLELRALACALTTPIHVFSAESDVISMGDEFEEREPLQLTYHLHYYTLGEHFNSVMPM
ncbi:hypothetical protein Poli38472_002562 [Pythium oligandrum]|uniref:OTU domain-containing protein n=1 Tax=Pythium oligandrum TaxID=41045 RepID=A0A8K1CHF6_PYTOL|nr:hypothetical protein Poli38472_002562 [Pythium oligandrum]|eukprot:TMW63621.1 hypothetical protein Poli38472_002562 [Pythium oligandrum]